MINSDTLNKSSQEILNRVNLILEKGKPPFDYGNILLKNYNQHITSYFNGENPIPYEIEIQPSSKCNANCSHCWAKNFERLEDKLETKENVDRVINRVLDFERKGFPLPRIKFCGSTGDPLMNPIINHIIDLFYEKRNMRLFTNGIKIGQNKDDLKYIHSLSKLDSIYLSLDAGTTETLWKIKPGARERGIKIEDILNGAKRISELGNTEIYASYVITKDTYLDITKAAKKAKENKFKLIRYRIDLGDRDISRDKGYEIIEGLKEAKKYGDENFKVIPIHSDEEIKETDSNCFSSKGLGLKCYTNLFWTCVGPNGKVYPCGHITSPETENYGSLLENTFDEIWDGKKIEEARAKTPNGLCKICSPFSLTTNKIMNDISNLERGELFRILREKL
jgi:radical SAM protein with 4Fe4S-binding SPASM domain